MAGMGWLTIVLGLTCICAAYGQIGCKSADGAPVDWWAALKAPEGGDFAYIDSTQETPTFQFTNGVDLGATKARSGSPLAETMLQIYKNDVGYVLWNDQPLSKGKARIPKLHAHAKGVLGFQKKGNGFYLMHSNPNFPDNPAKTTKYQGINDCTKSSPKKCGPDYGQDEYGQSYFCVSLNSTNLDAVALVLRGNGLVVYAGDIADAAQELPNVDALIKKDAQGLRDIVYGDPITSVGGEEFLLFGMKPTDGNHPVFLYEQIVGPTLKAGMKVQTWTQKDRFPTYCPGGTQPDNFTVEYSTINVEYITIGGTPLKWNAAGEGQKDHSKWAVTITSDSTAPTQTMRRLQDDPHSIASSRRDSGVKVLCFADINRAGDQAFRGGGAICFADNIGMWKAFDDIITGEEPCQT